MAKLIYSSITSIDGYIADREGNFDWAEPDDELHTFVNDAARPIGTYLLGRRMYEVLVAWETMPTADQPHYIADYAEIWRRADKIVYSSTLKKVASARTRIERTFDLDVVRQLKTTTAKDISVSGPALAASSIRAGLVDEYLLYVVPSLVGGGIRCFPDDVRLDLELLDERRFANGTVLVRYGSKT